MGIRPVPQVDYQSETNVRGLITTNQTSHSFRPEPCLNRHPVRTTICDGKPLEMMMQNPLPLHDTYVTTNGVFHGAKFQELEYRQPLHLLAMPLNGIQFIKPDFHHKVAKGGFNPNPIYVSETTEQFRVADRHPLPILHITSRYEPLKREVFNFDRDDPYSVLRMSHPYMSTSQMAHRQFPPEVYESGRIHPSKAGIARIHQVSSGVPEIKVGPMEDPLEQNVKVHPNLDVYKDYPSGTDNDCGRKHFFRVPLYKGSQPRVFLPVDHVGWSPTTASTFTAPLSSLDKNNSTSPVKVCYFQPRHSSRSAMSIPWMYSTESKVYGSGRNVCTYVKNKDLDICGDTCIF